MLLLLPQFPSGKPIFAGQFNVLLPVHQCGKVTTDSIFKNSSNKEYRAVIGLVVIALKQLSVWMGRCGLLNNDKRLCNPKQRCKIYWQRIREQQKSTSCEDQVTFRGHLEIFCLKTGMVKKKIIMVKTCQAPFNFGVPLTICKKHSGATFWLCCIVQWE